MAISKSITSTEPKCHKSYPLKVVASGIDFCVKKYRGGNPEESAWDIKGADKRKVKVIKCRRRLANLKVDSNSNLNCNSQGEHLLDCCFLNLKSL